MATFGTLSDRLADTFKNLRTKGKLSPSDVDGTVREIRRALLDADVAPREVLAELVPLASHVVFSDAGLFRLEGISDGDAAVVEQALHATRDFAAERELGSPDRAWSVFCQGLLVSNEFRYVD